MLILTRVLLSTTEIRTRTDDDQVEDVVQSFPLQLSDADLVDQGLGQVSGRHFADVVDADVELVALVDERVAAATSLVEKSQE